MFVMKVDEEKALRSGLRVSREEAATRKERPGSRRDLRASLGRDGMDARGSVADLRAAAAGGGGLSGAEVGDRYPSDLPPAHRPRAGAHPGVLPRLCAPEDAPRLTGPD